MSQTLRNEFKEFVCSPELLNTTVMQLVIIAASEFVPALYIMNICIERAFSQNYYGNVVVKARIAQPAWLYILYCTPILPFVVLSLKKLGSRFNIFILLETIQRYVLNPLICLELGYTLHICAFIFVLAVCYFDIFMFDIYCHCINDIECQLPKQPYSHIYILLNNLAALVFAQARHSLVFSVFIMLAYEVILNFIYWTRLFIFQSLLIDLVFHSICSAMLGLSFAILLTVWVDLQFRSFLLLHTTVPVATMIATVLFRELRLNRISMRMARLLNYIVISVRSLNENMLPDVSHNHTMPSEDLNVVETKLREETGNRLTDLYYQLMSTHICEHPENFDYIHGYMLDFAPERSDQPLGQLYSVFQVHEFLRAEKFSILDFNAMYLWLNQIQQKRSRKNLQQVCELFAMNQPFTQDISTFTNQEEDSLRTILANYVKLAAVCCLQLSIVHYQDNFDEFSISFLLQSIKRLALENEEKSSEHTSIASCQGPTMEYTCSGISFEFWYNQEQHNVVLLTEQDCTLITAYARRFLAYVQQYVLIEEDQLEMTVYDTVSSVCELIEEYDMEHCMAAIAPHDEKKSSYFRCQLATYQDFAINIKLLYNHLSLVNKYIVPYEELQTMLQLFMLMLLKILTQEIAFNDDIAVFATIKVPYRIEEQRILNVVNFIEEYMPHRESSNHHVTAALLLYVKRLSKHKNVECRLNATKYTQELELRQDNYYCIEKLLLQEMETTNEQIHFLCKLNDQPRSKARISDVYAKIKRLEEIFSHFTSIERKMLCCQDCLNFVHFGVKYDHFQFRKSFDFTIFAQHRVVLDNSVIRHLQHRIVSSPMLLLQSERYIAAARYQYEICVNLKFKLQYQIYLFVINREVSQNEYVYINQLRYIRKLENRFLSTLQLMISSLYKIAVFDKNNFFALFQLEKYLYDLNISSLLYELMGKFASGALEGLTLEQFVIMYIDSQINQLYGDKFHPELKKQIYCAHYKEFMQTISLQDISNRENLKSITLRTENHHNVRKNCIMEEDVSLSIKEGIPEEKTKAAFERLIFYKNRFLNFFRKPSCIMPENKEVHFFKSFSRQLSDQIISVIGWFNSQKNSVLLTLLILFAAELLAFLFLEQVNILQFRLKRQQFELQDEFFDAHLTEFGSNSKNEQILLSQLVTETTSSVIEKLGNYIYTFIQLICLVPQLLIRNRNIPEHIDFHQSPVENFSETLLQENRHSTANNAIGLSASNNYYFHEKTHSGEFKSNLLSKLIEVLATDSSGGKNLALTSLLRQKCKNSSYLTCIVRELPQFENIRLKEFPNSSEDFTVIEREVVNKESRFDYLMLPAILEDMSGPESRERSAANYRLGYENPAVVQREDQLFPSELSRYQVVSVAMIVLLVILVIWSMLYLVISSRRENQKIIKTITSQCYFRQAGLFPYFLTSNEIFKEFRISNRYIDILKSIILEQSIPCQPSCKESVISVDKAEIIVPVDKCECEKCGIELLSLQWRKICYTAALLLMLFVEIILVVSIKERSPGVAGSEIVRNNSRKLLSMSYYPYFAAKQYIKSGETSYLAKLRIHNEIMKETNCSSIFSYDLCIEHDELFEQLVRQLETGIEQLTFFEHPQLLEESQIPVELRQMYFDLLQWRETNSPSDVYPETVIGIEAAKQVLLLVQEETQHMAFQEFMRMCDANECACEFSSCKIELDAENTYREIELLLEGYFVEYELSEQQEFYIYVREYGKLIVCLVFFAICHVFILWNSGIKGALFFSIFYLLDLFLLLYIVVSFKYTATREVGDVGFAHRYIHEEPYETDEIEATLGFNHPISSSIVLNTSHLMPVERHYISQAIKSPSTFKQTSIVDFLANECNETSSAYEAIVRLYEIETQHPFEVITVSFSNNYIVICGQLFFIGSTIIIILLINLRSKRGRGKHEKIFKQLVVEPFATVNVRVGGKYYKLYGRPSESIKISQNENWEKGQMREEAQLLLETIHTCVNDEKMLDALVRNPPKLVAIAIHGVDGAITLKPARILVPEENWCHSCYLERYCAIKTPRELPNMDFHIHYIFPWFVTGIVIICQGIIVYFMIILIIEHYERLERLEFYVGLQHLLQILLGSIVEDVEELPELLFDKLQYYAFEGGRFLDIDERRRLRALYFNYQPLIIKRTPIELAKKIKSVKNMLAIKVEELANDYIDYRAYEFVFQLGSMVLVTILLHYCTTRLNDFYASIEKIHCSLCEV